MKAARILLISNPNRLKPRDTAADSRPQFRVKTKRLPRATASTFHRKLDKALEHIGFTEGVREICKPAYADAARGGCPSMDPAVYFKILMIGFFENFLRHCFQLSAQIPATRNILNPESRREV